MDGMDGLMFVSIAVSMRIAYSSARIHIPSFCYVDRARDRWENTPPREEVVADSFELLDAALL